MKTCHDDGEQCKFAEWNTKVANLNDPAINECRHWKTTSKELKAGFPDADTTDNHFFSCYEHIIKPAAPTDNDVKSTLGRFSVV